MESVALPLLSELDVAQALLSRRMPLGVQLERFLARRAYSRKIARATHPSYSWIDVAIRSLQLEALAACTSTASLPPGPALPLHKVADMLTLEAAREPGVTVFDEKSAPWFAFGARVSHFLAENGWSMSMACADCGACLIYAVHPHCRSNRLRRSVGVSGPLPPPAFLPSFFESMLSGLMQQDAPSGDRSLAIVPSLLEQLASTLARYDGAFSVPSDPSESRQIELVMCAIMRALSTRQLSSVQPGRAAKELLRAWLWRGGTSCVLDAARFLLSPAAPDQLTADMLDILYSWQTRIRDMKRAQLSFGASSVHCAELHALTRTQLVHDSTHHSHRSVSTDGTFIFVLDSQLGLLKFGSGYGGTDTGRLYGFKVEFAVLGHGSIGVAGGFIYISTPLLGGNELLKVKADTLDIVNERIVVGAQLSRDPAARGLAFPATITPHTVPHHRPVINAFRIEYAPEPSSRGQQNKSSLDWKVLKWGSSDQMEDVGRLFLQPCRPGHVGHYAPDQYIYLDKKGFAITPPPGTRSKRQLCRIRVVPTAPARLPHYHPICGDGTNLYIFVLPTAQWLIDEAAPPSHDQFATSERAVFRLPSPAPFDTPSLSSSISSSAAAAALAADTAVPANSAAPSTPTSPTSTTSPTISLGIDITQLAPPTSNPQRPPHFTPSARHPLQGLSHINSAAHLISSTTDGSRAGKPPFAVAPIDMWVVSGGAPLRTFGASALGTVRYLLPDTIFHILPHGMLRDPEPSSPSKSKPSAPAPSPDVLSCCSCGLVHSPAQPRRMFRCTEASCADLYLCHLCQAHSHHLCPAHTDSHVMREVSADVDSPDHLHRRMLERDAFLAFRDLLPHEQRVYSSLWRELIDGTFFVADGKFVVASIPNPQPVVKQPPCRLHSILLSDLPRTEVTSEVSPADSLRRVLREFKPSAWHSITLLTASEAFCFDSRNSLVWGFSSVQGMLQRWHSVPTSAFAQPHPFSTVARPPYRPAQALALPLHAVQTLLSESLVITRDATYLHKCMHSALSILISLWGATYTENINPAALDTLLTHLEFVERLVLACLDADYSAWPDAPPPSDDGDVDMDDAQAPPDILQWRRDVLQMRTVLITILAAVQGAPAAVGGQLATAASRVLTTGLNLFFPSWAELAHLHLELIYGALPVDWSQARSQALRHMGPVTAEPATHRLAVSALRRQLHRVSRDRYLGMLRMYSPNAHGNRLHHVGRSAEIIVNADPSLLSDLVQHCARLTLHHATASDTRAIFNSFGYVVADNVLAGTEARFTPQQPAPTPTDPDRSPSYELPCDEQHFACYFAPLFHAELFRLVVSTSHQNAQWMCMPWTLDGTVSHELPTQADGDPDAIAEQQAKPRPPPRSSAPEEGSFPNIPFSHRGPVGDHTWKTRSILRQSLSQTINSHHIEALEKPYATRNEFSVTLHMRMQAAMLDHARAVFSSTAALIDALSIGSENTDARTVWAMQSLTSLESVTLASPVRQPTRAKPRQRDTAPSSNSPLKRSRVSADMTDEESSLSGDEVMDDAAPAPAPSTTPNLLADPRVTADLVSKVLTESALGTSLHWCTYWSRHARTSALAAAETAAVTCELMRCLERVAMLCMSRRSVLLQEMELTSREIHRRKNFEPKSLFQTSNALTNVVLLLANPDFVAPSPWTLMDMLRRNPNDVNVLDSGDVTAFSAFQAAWSHSRRSPLQRVRFIRHFRRVSSKMGEREGRSFVRSIPLLKQLLRHVYNDAITTNFALQLMYASTSLVEPLRPGEIPPYDVPVTESAQSRQLVFSGLRDAFERMRRACDELPRHSLCDAELLCLALARAPSEYSSALVSALGPWQLSAPLKLAMYLAWHPRLGRFSSLTPLVRPAELLAFGVCILGSGRLHDALEFAARRDVLVWLTAQMQRRDDDWIELSRKRGASDDEAAPAAQPSGRQHLPPEPEWLQDMIRAVFSNMRQRYASFLSTVALKSPGMRPTDAIADDVACIEGRLRALIWWHLDGNAPSSPDLSPVLRTSDDTAATRSWRANLSSITSARVAEDMDTMSVRFVSSQSTSRLTVSNDLRWFVRYITSPRDSLEGVQSLLPPHDVSRFKSLLEAAAGDTVTPTAVLLNKAMEHHEVASKEIVGYLLGDCAASWAARAEFVLPVLSEALSTRVHLSHLFPSINADTHDMMCRLLMQIARTDSPCCTRLLNLDFGPQHCFALLMSGAVQSLLSRVRKSGELPLDVAKAAMRLHPRVSALRRERDNQRFMFDTDELKTLRLEPGEDVDTVLEQRLSRAFQTKSDAWNVARSLLVRCLAHEVQAIEDGVPEDDLPCRGLLRGVFGVVWDMVVEDLATLHYLPAVDGSTSRLGRIVASHMHAVIDMLGTLRLFSDRFRLASGEQLAALLRVSLLLEGVKHPASDQYAADIAEFEEAAFRSSFLERISSDASSSLPSGAIKAMLAASWVLPSAVIEPVVRLLQVELRYHKPEELTLKLGDDATARLLDAIGSLHILSAAVSHMSPSAGAPDTEERPKYESQPDEVLAMLEGATAAAWMTRVPNQREVLAPFLPFARTGSRPFTMESMKTCKRCHLWFTDEEYMRHREVCKEAFARIQAGSSPPYVRRINGVSVQVPPLAPQPGLSVFDSSHGGTKDVPIEHLLLRDKSDQEWMFVGWSTGAANRRSAYEGMIALVRNLLHDVRWADPLEAQLRRVAVESDLLSELAPDGQRAKHLSTREWRRGLAAWDVLGGFVPSLVPGATVEYTVAAPAPESFVLPPKSRADNCTSHPVHANAVQRGVIMRISRSGARVVLVTRCGTDSRREGLDHDGRPAQRSEFDLDDEDESEEQATARAAKNPVWHHLELPIENICLVSAVEPPSSLLSSWLSVPSVCKVIKAIVVANRQPHESQKHELYRDVVKGQLAEAVLRAVEGALLRGHAPDQGLGLEQLLGAVVSQVHKLDVASKTQTLAGHVPGSTQVFRSFPAKAAQHALQALLARLQDISDPAGRIIELLPAVLPDPPPAKFSDPQSGPSKRAGKSAHGDGMRRMSHLSGPRARERSRSRRRRLQEAQVAIQANLRALNAGTEAGLELLQRSRDLHQRSDQHSQRLVFLLGHSIAPSARRGRSRSRGSRRRGRGHVSRSFSIPELDAMAPNAALSVSQANISAPSASAAAPAPAVTSPSASAASGNDVPSIVPEVVPAPALEPTPPPTQSHGEPEPEPPARPRIQEVHGVVSMQSREVLRRAWPHFGHVRLTQLTPSNVSLVYHSTVARLNATARDEIKPGSVVLFKPSSPLGKPDAELELGEVVRATGDDWWLVAPLLAGKADPAQSAFPAKELQLPTSLPPSFLQRLRKAGEISSRRQHLGQESDDREQLYVRESLLLSELDPVAGTPLRVAAAVNAARFALWRHTVVLFESRGRALVNQSHNPDLVQEAFKEEAPAPFPLGSVVVISSKAVQLWSATLNSHTFCPPAGVSVGDQVLVMDHSFKWCPAIVRRMQRMATSTSGEPRVLILVSFIGWDHSYDRWIDLRSLRVSIVALPCGGAPPSVLSLGDGASLLHTVVEGLTGVVWRFDSTHTRALVRVATTSAAGTAPLARGSHQYVWLRVEDLALYDEFVAQPHLLQTCEEKPAPPAGPKVDEDSEMTHLLPHMDVLAEDCAQRPQASGATPALGPAPAPDELTSGGGMGGRPPLPRSAVSQDLTAMQGMGIPAAAAAASAAAHAAAAALEAASEVQQGVYNSHATSCHMAVNLKPSASAMHSTLNGHTDGPFHVSDRELLTRSPCSIALLAVQAQDIATRGMLRRLFESLVLHTDVLATKSPQDLGALVLSWPTPWLPSAFEPTEGDLQIDKTIAIPPNRCLPFGQMHLIRRKLVGEKLKYGGAPRGGGTLGMRMYNEGRMCANFDSASGPTLHAFVSALPSVVFVANRPAPVLERRLAMLQAVLKRLGVVAAPAQQPAQAMAASPADDVVLGSGEPSAPKRQRVADVLPGLARSVDVVKPPQQSLLGVRRRRTATMVDDGDGDGGGSLGRNTRPRLSAAVDPAMSDEEEEDDDDISMHGEEESGQTFLGYPHVGQIASSPTPIPSMRQTESPHESPPPVDQGAPRSPPEFASLADDDMMMVNARPPADDFFDSMLTELEAESEQHERQWHAQVVTKADDEIKRAMSPAVSFKGVHQSVIKECDAGGPDEDREVRMLWRALGLSPSAMDPEDRTVTMTYGTLHHALRVQQFFRLAHDCANTTAVSPSKPELARRSLSHGVVPIVPAMWHFGPQRLLHLSFPPHLGVRAMCVSFLAETPLPFGMLFFADRDRTVLVKHVAPDMQASPTPFVVPNDVYVSLYRSDVLAPKLSMTEMRWLVVVPDSTQHLDKTLLCAELLMLRGWSDARVGTQSAQRCVDLLCRAVTALHAVFPHPTSSKARAFSWLVALLQHIPAREMSERVKLLFLSIRHDAELRAVSELVRETLRAYVRSPGGAGLGSLYLARCNELLLALYIKFGASVPLPAGVHTHLRFVGDVVKEWHALFMPGGKLANRLTTARRASAGASAAAAAAAAAGSASAASHSSRFGSAPVTTLLLRAYEQFQLAMRAVRREDYDRKVDASRRAREAQLALPAMEPAMEPEMLPVMRSIVGPADVLQVDEDGDESMGAAHESLAIDVIAGVPNELWRLRSHRAQPSTPGAAPVDNDLTEYESPPSTGGPASGAFNKQLREVAERVQRIAQGQQYHELSLLPLSVVCEIARVSRAWQARVDKELNPSELSQGPDAARFDRLPMRTLAELLVSFVDMSPGGRYVSLEELELRAEHTPRPEYSPLDVPVPTTDELVLYVRHVLPLPERLEVVDAILNATNHSSSHDVTISISDQLHAHRQLFRGEERLDTAVPADDSEGNEVDVAGEVDGVGVEEPEAVAGVPVGGDVGVDATSVSEGFNVSYKASNPSASIFEQLHAHLQLIASPALRSRAAEVTWTVRFAGEMSVGAMGDHGPFRQVLSLVCAELRAVAYQRSPVQPLIDQRQFWYRQRGQPSVRSAGGNSRGGAAADSKRDVYRAMLRKVEGGSSFTFPGLLIPCPNFVAETGDGRAKLVVNPGRRSTEDLRRFASLGKLLGVSMRSHTALDLNLNPVFWKQLVGVPLDSDSRRQARAPLGEASNLPRGDLYDLDYSLWQSLQLRGISEEEFDAAFDSLRYECVLSDGRTLVPLVPGGHGKRVRFADVDEYARLVSHARLTESAAQMDAVRQGFFDVVPLEAVALLTWEQVERRICGDPVFRVDLLRRYTRVSGVEASHRIVTWFWRVLESLDEVDKARFLQFAWARSRLPDENQPNLWRRMQITFTPASPGSDARLPTSETCFFNVRMPTYSSEAVLRDRLLIAIRNSSSLNS